MRRARTLTLLLLVAASCRPDEIELAYGFRAGEEIHYRMTAHAQAEWDVGGSGSGGYTVVFDVTERFVEADDQSATVEVVMTPVTVDDRGLPSPGAQERSFALEVGRDGDVLDILELNGVPARALDADELAFIGTYRPPLPGDPVSLGHRWEAEQRVRLNSVFQQVSTTGSLEGLDRDAAGEVAFLAYEGKGPLAWATELPQGEADLTGSASTSGEAAFDLGARNLRSASSRTEGTFEVRIVTGPDQAPITGTLRLDLRLQVRRVAT